MIAVNQYFDGKVKSISFNNSQGKVTSGVMDTGDYVFSTSEDELMKVVSGALFVKLPSEDTFTEYATGDQFKVAANSEFAVLVKEQTAYLCFYS